MESIDMDMSKDLQINTAIAFLDIGSYANDLDRDFSRQSMQFKSDAYYAIPSLVNLAFSCEIFLKAILNISNVEYGKTHSLCDLYNKLPDVAKAQLNIAFKDRCAYPVSFEETMKVHSNTFPDFRYIFEEKNKLAYGYPDNLQLAAEVMRDLLHDIEASK